MTEMEPVTLVAHLDLPNESWSVASVNSSFDVAPIIQSQPNDLAPWSDGTLDEQLSFLRHRIAGILQRGADRLWGRQQKAQMFVVDFRCDDNLATREVVAKVSEHFCTWMLKPPVICLSIQQDGTLDCIASNTSSDEFGSFAAVLQEIRTLANQTEHWELAPPPSGH